MPRCVSHRGLGIEVYTSVRLCQPAACIAASPCRPALTAPPTSEGTQCTDLAPHVHLARCGVPRALGVTYMSRAP